MAPKWDEVYRGIEGITRRMRVSGGWLYLHMTISIGENKDPPTSTMCFVPDSKPS